MTSSLGTLVEDTGRRAEQDGLGFTPRQLAVLENLYANGKFSTILQRADKLPASLPGGVAVAYSGKLSDGNPSRQTAGRYVAAVPGTYRVDETEVGQYLGDDSTWGGKGADVVEVNRAFTAVGEPELEDGQDFYIQEPAWRAASENFAEQARGPMVAFASKPREFAAFTRQEVPIAIHSPEVPAINGVATSELRASADPVRDICGACDRAIAEGKTAELGQFNGPEQARDVAARGLEGAATDSPAKAGEASRAELDAQLRSIAQDRARNPEGPITALGDTGKREVSGKVLGYTAGKEEALFQRTGGGLLQVDMRGRPELPVGREIDLDVKSGGLSGRGLAH